MELDAEDGTGGVGDGHDRAVLGARVHAQAVGDGALLDDQRVIASRLHRIGAAREEPLAAMADRAHFAVHRHRSADHLRPERLGDGLMAEADAEERDGGVGANEVDAAAGASGRAGAGGDDQG
jgi:hypothetical protein